MADIKEYKKSLEDEIDWKIIDQLHTATLNFSSTSLELKKIFFILIGIAVPSLIKLANNKLDTSLFITIYLLAMTFYFLDSFTYYYQEKLREKMDKHFSKIKRRNIEILIVVEKKEDDFTLENNRTSTDRVKRSLINPSVRLYMFVFALNTLAYLIYLIGCIS